MTAFLPTLPKDPRWRLGPGAALSALRWACARARAELWSWWNLPALYDTTWQAARVLSWKPPPAVRPGFQAGLRPSAALTGG